MVPVFPPNCTHNDHVVNWIIPIATRLAVKKKGLSCSLDFSKDHADDLPPGNVNPLFLEEFTVGDFRYVLPGWSLTSLSNETCAAAAASLFLWGDFIAGFGGDLIFFPIFLISFFSAVVVALPDRVLTILAVWI